MKTTIRQIAKVKSNFKEKFGIPRQSGRANSIKSQIIFNKEFSSPDAFRELEGFSHVWILFDFSLSHTQHFTPTVRPPRLGGNKKVGVFASRSPFRPNNIGLSCVKLENIEFDKQGIAILTVSGADILDGTPVYDVKPYLSFTDSIPDASLGYTKDYVNHKLKVVFDKDLKINLSQTLINEIVQCLSDDPRPSYQNDERTYGMKYASYDVLFKVKDDILTIIDIKNV